MVNNVIRNYRPIKGSCLAYPQFIAGKDVPWLNGYSHVLVMPTACPRSWLLEDFFGGGAMRLRALHVRLHAGDLGPQGLDSSLQLLDRHGIQVLTPKLHQGVAGLAREQIIEVHRVNR